MKKIKIKFSGMGGHFKCDDNFIINILRQKYDVELSDTPDFLIYSVNSKDYLDYDCVRIFYTAENLVPDFNICDYAIGFHYITFEDRYMRYPLYMVEDFNAYLGDDYSKDLYRALHKHENADDFFQNKTDFCSFVYSNFEAAQCRQSIYDGLSNYKKINSGGKYLNNIGGVLENKLDFQSKHKFVIAFENSMGSGYTTEKIVHAFSAGAVPIYWGNPQISNEFNEKAFINCHRFGLSENGEDKSIGKIIERVIEIDQDDNLYYEMLRTPAFNDMCFVDETKVEFENYLIHIFDQPVDTAFRRNKLYWGLRYERKQKIGNGFYWQLRKLIPIRDYARKLLRK